MMIWGTSNLVIFSMEAKKYRGEKTDMNFVVLIPWLKTLGLLLKMASTFLSF